MGDEVGDDGVGDGDDDDVDGVGYRRWEWVWFGVFHSALASFRVVHCICVCLLASVLVRWSGATPLLTISSQKTCTHKTTTAKLRAFFINLPAGKNNARV